MEAVVVASGACMLPDKSRPAVAEATNEGEEIEAKEEEPGSN